MRHGLSRLLIAVGLLASSAALYCVHYLVFRDAHHIYLYLLGDVAFVPIQVLLVVVLIEHMLAEHERREKLNKLNMVIGAFFSEVGTRLLGELTPAVRGEEQVRHELDVKAGWQAADFQRAMAFARKFPYEVDARSVDLDALRELLVGQREFILRLLENPNLLEHESFSDLLWAVLHLAEELTARPSLHGLPEKDLEHLGTDTRRAYAQLAAEWLAYVRHLRADYPFLFSLVARTHPMQEHPSAVIT